MNADRAGSASESLVRAKGDSCGTKCHIRPEHFQSPEYYKSRKDAYTQQLNTIVETLQKVVICLISFLNLQKI
jgi:hypothetical protein